MQSPRSEEINTTTNFLFNVLSPLQPKYRFRIGFKKGGGVTWRTALGVTMGEMQLRTKNCALPSNIPTFVFLWITYTIINCQLHSTPGTNAQRFKNEYKKSVSLTSKNYKHKLRKSLQENAPHFNSFCNKICLCKHQNQHPTL